MRRTSSILVISVVLLSLFSIMPPCLAESIEKTIVSKISSGIDDVMEINGRMRIDTNHLAMGLKWGNTYRSGYRFAVDLRQGVLIKEATISFGYNWASGSSNINFYGEATDNANSFSDNDNDISDRPKTGAKVDWNDLSKTGWGTYLTSTDISSIIQEIVDRPNWEAGNSLVILAYESPDTENEWEAISYEGTPWRYGHYAATLKITALIQEDSPPPEPKKNIVIFSVHDIQEDWKEDVQQKIIEMHMEKGIDINLITIPSRLEGGSMLPLLQSWYNNYPNMIEIVGHGWNHRERMGGSSYEYQRKILEKVKNQFAEWGINIFGWVSPRGENDVTTLKAMKDVGYHTLITGLDISLEYGGITTITDAIYLASGTWGGQDSTFKPNSQIIEEIDQQIKERGYAQVAFHMFDFNNINSEKFVQYSELLDILKASGKYTFMTPEEYHQSLS